MATHPINSINVAALFGAPGPQLRFSEAMAAAVDAAECTCDADPLGVCRAHPDDMSAELWNACLADALQDCEDSRPKKTRYR